MSQPPAYQRRFGFTDFAASNPNLPLPGSAVDSEMDAIEATVVAVLRNLAIIQRDDGALKNRIVTIDALSPAALIALGAGAVWLPRGPWAAGASYATSDVISVGTASYVCSMPHAAGAAFAGDLAAGYWTILYDDAGSTPQDGSVTEPKLADGAVSERAIGFTALDLINSIRAAAGLRAGDAPVGELIHARASTGNVYGKVERRTAAPGRVGYRITNAAVTWTLDASESGQGLELRSSLLAAATTFFTPTGGLDQAGALRAINGAVPTIGAGVAMTFSGTTGLVTSYDYDATKWRDLKLRGATVSLTAGGVDVMRATPTGVEFIAGTVARAGADLGYLDAPQNVQSGAYQLVLADRGKHIYSANAAGQSIVIPTNSATAFPIGSVIAIINDGAGAITISAPGVILKQAGSGSAGTRTLAANGQATLLKVGADRWFISGAGVA